jgi:hypothetical protein
MPAQGYGCRWMYIDASAPTTVAQNQNRNNNCKSIRLVRDVAVLTAIASTGTEVTSLSVYPNTAGEYTVSGVSGAETLMLYDLAGSLVFVQPVENGSSISLSRLAKGIYIAKAGNKAVKLIKR